MKAGTDAQQERLLFATQVYRHYAALIVQAPQGLGGSLLLATDEALEPGSLPASAAASAESLIRAANIAGAASLLITPNAALARERVRNGVCDFLVTNLDEALRILKNELRRKLAVAVCLLADPALILAECVQRGVQPDLLAPSTCTHSHSLVQRGARLLHTLSHPCNDDRREIDTSMLRLAGWTLPTSGTRLLSSIDAVVRDVLGGYAHSERLRWLARAPQYLGRTLASTHTVPLLPFEWATLAQTLALSMHEQRIPSEISFHYGDQTLP